MEAKCSNCEETFRPPAEAGRVECPRCGAVVDVPAAGDCEADAIARPSEAFRGEDRTGVRAMRRRA